MSWNDILIEEVCNVKGGKRLPAGHDLTEEITSHPYIRARDIRNGKINFTDPKYITKETHQKISRYTVKEGDVIITIVGANIGDVAYVPEEFNGANLTENAVKIIAKREVLDPRFLKYALLPEYAKEYMQIVASGAAQGKLGLYKIKKLPIPYPPLPIQKKIAGILSAYDDLIENNLKRIKLLEELAQITYEEWYLYRRIDGSVITDDEIALTPIKELVKNFRNGGWGKEEIEGSYLTQAYVIRGTDIPDIHSGKFSSVPLRYHTEKNYLARKLEPGDITMEMSNGNIQNVGRSLYYDEGVRSSLNDQAMCASFCKMIRPLNRNFSYLIDQHIKYIHQNDQMLVYKSQGANGINNFRFESMITDENIAVPNLDALKRLTDKFKAIYKTKALLRTEINFLSEARDILLPRLMTGMIDVEDYDPSKLLQEAA